MALVLRQRVEEAVAAEVGARDPGRLLPADELAKIVGAITDRVRACRRADRSPPRQHAGHMALDGAC